jgi:hypothetical protein
MTNVPEFLTRAESLFSLMVDHLSRIAALGPVNESQVVCWEFVMQVMTQLRDLHREELARLRGESPSPREQES